MRQLKIDAEERDLSRRPLTLDELDALIGKRPHLPFLNTRNALYRELGLKAAPPDRQRALELMAKEPNLVRRPLLSVGDQILFGYDEQAFREALAP